MLPEAVELIVFGAGALIFAAVFAPASLPRRRMLLSGSAGLVGTAVIAAVPTLDLALFALLAMGVLQAAGEGGRPFAVRLRPPVIAVAMLSLGLLFLRAEGPDVLGRLAAVGLVAGLAAAVGLLPFLHPLEPDEPLASSPVGWLALVGPVLAAVVVSKTQGLLSADSGAAFGVMLIALGLLNVAWGGLASWLTESEVAAWRYSFVGDWGLVLCGFGLTVADGQRAALLVLFSIIVGRLPLYLAARPALRERAASRRPINLVVAAALAGSAPFAGFAARILLLRAGTQVFWPFALVLAVGMLLWLPGSMRLGRSLAMPRGRQALGIAIVLAVNVVAGLYPQPLLAAARL